MWLTAQQHRALIQEFEVPITAKRIHSITEKRGPKLDLSLFDPDLLRQDEVALEIATGVLETYLVNPANDIDCLIKDLSTISHLLEYALSVISDDVFSILTERILDNFPATAEIFLSSTPSQLLNQFSLYYCFLDPKACAQEPLEVREGRRLVELALPVLTALATYAFDDEHTGVDDLAAVEGDVFLVKSAKSGQHSKKKAKAAKRKHLQHGTIDSKPFDLLKVTVPHDQTEAEALVASILAEQKGMLQRYLQAFRNPQLQTLYKTSYLPEQVAANVQAAAGHRSQGDLPPSPVTDKEIVPAAYPMIQPMKAALYFDSAEGFGEWRILISTRADSDLRQTRKKNLTLFNIIIKKIKELSNGHFSDDNQKYLKGTEIVIPIFEAKMTRDSRLIYQIDCVPEFETVMERQVIKLFGIYTHAQLDKRFWAGVGYQLGRKGEEYKRRCNFRNKPCKIGQTANIILPASWPPVQESPEMAPSSGLPDLHKDDLEKLHDLLVLEKYVTFSQALLNSIMVDVDVAHVFDVSPLEKEIIEYAHSCYVLGRSGTGKTTTMMFKMLGIERSWLMYGNTLPNKPRQIFVTQSRVLADKVKEFFQKLYESLGSADKSPEEIKKIMEARHSHQEQGLVDLDEEVDRRGDLPRRFGDLTEEHFPLFVTYDQLCRMLELELGSLSADGQAKFLQQNTHEEPAERLVSNDYMQQRHAAFVSYGVFLESYWPHFPQPLTKGIDPALVFGEFMGILKGSEQTLAFETHCLDQETYVNLSYRTQATFASQREAIYKLFQAYLKRKRERHDYDAADRTHAILKELRQSVPEKLVDFLYVDEAQDNLLIDALVLRTICKNPETGLFWAGDTAQTISIGSSFRFDDLKAFLYRIENAGNDKRVAHPPPRSFQLSVNYRSHAGIVNCAHSIIELITRFWPNAIDTLAPERGIIEGLKPIFFSGWEENSVRYEQFLFGETGNQIEFGAQQCILVRNDAARQRLRAQVGNIGLILTLYESKGLEFNDVLLYNFFADSTVELGQWRVVLNAITEEQRNRQKAPTFDDARHNGVCRDLKFLYVAITRARKNIWIADTSDKGEPMRVFWTARDQIQNCVPGSDVPRLAMSSTAEEWATTALALFNNRRYSQAMHCYERASRPRERDVARAYSLRETARATHIDHNESRNREHAFIDAADAFWASAQEASKEKLAYFRIAAECYVLCGNIIRAGQAYIHALEFTLAAQQYRKAGMFDEAVAVIKSHRSDMDKAVIDSIIAVSRLEYLRGHKLKQALELFESHDEALEFMDDCGLDIAQVALLEELGRFGEAAELHLAEGRIPTAIETFLKDKGNPSSSQRASQCLRNGLWCILSLGVSAASDLAQANSTFTGLVQMLTSLDIASLEEDVQDELAMFRAIVSNDTKSLLDLSIRFHQWHKDDAAALRCLDHVFAKMPKLQVAPLFEIATWLQKFLLYARLLQKYAFDPDPCDNVDIRRLLGFQPATDDLLLISHGTQLSTYCNDRSTPSFRATEQGILVLRWELQTLLKDFFRGRLHAKVLGERDLCYNLRASQPCLAFTSHGRCNRSDTGECWQDHVVDYTADVYNLRVRIHLQQILIYHTVYALEHWKDRAKHCRYWLRRLHEALDPPFYKMGSPAQLNPQAIPEYANAVQVATIWVLDWLYDLVPFRAADYVPTFLTSLIRATSLAFVFDPQAADNNIPRVRCVSTFRPYMLMRGPAQDQTYIVHDLLSFIQDRRAISLSRGILFVFHILEQRIPIDVGVLCNYLDHLCCLLILHYRSKNGATLHDITLPYSWLIQSIDSLEKLGEKDTKLVYLYIRPMANLIEQMFTGNHADHLLYENRNLPIIGWQIRNTFVSRICKNLCLLGYNFRELWLRLDVLKIVTSISRHVRKSDPLLDSYVSARTWQALARTVRQSTTGTSLDEMIHLHDASKAPDRFPSFPNVRQVIYRSVEEVPSLLMSGVTSFLRGDAIPFLPSGLSERAAEEEESALDVSEQMDSAQQLDEEEAEDGAHGTATLEVENDAKDMATISAEDDQLNSAAVLPTEGELRAAGVILTAYRQYVRRARRDAPIKAIHAMRHRVVGLFQQMSPTMNWPHNYYPKLFMGPIPHAFVCLESMKASLHNAKDETKKQLKHAKHQDLERVNARLTEIVQLNKSITRLFKMLEPQSDLHKRRDIEELKACVVDVQKLSSKFPAGAAEEWQEDLALAHTAIVQPRSAPVKSPKPMLNVEDLYEGDSEGSY